MSKVKKKYVEGGEVFCIPLFWIGENYDPTNPLILSKQDDNKAFAFGRAIEDRGGAGILVEIFDLLGPIKTKCDEIVNSNRLFDPILMFWQGVRKKRWKVVCKTANYNKYVDSGYSDIKMVMEEGDGFYLKTFDTGEKSILSASDASSYESAKIWHPIHLEKRIAERIL
ncbi:Imm26 family immunity protein [Pedobacter alluvionis]|uniref:Immunity protein 26 of polymorphic toxin system n=1 Tax=Pedobacter alluvionis TaxID=475253 RepID=A0A497XMY8_9SPHI|nr:Imm26 family immunity protein [Pedobacter alluvionis]RLJ69178.1 immunity protein 26 of polymorphic toxin system [Pedobacter alluvionis]TFB29727.1 hypothetical protein E3V97_16145 [Pedobacter alluvionis]